MTVHMQFGVCQAQCDQLLEVNVAQTFQAVAQKVGKAVLNKKRTFHSNPKRHEIFGLRLKRKLVTKKCKNHTGQARIG